MCHHHRFNADDPFSFTYSRDLRDILLAYPPHFDIPASAAETVQPYIVRGVRQTGLRLLGGPEHRAGRTESRAELKIAGSWTLMAWVNLHHGSIDAGASQESKRMRVVSKGDDAVNYAMHITADGSVDCKISTVDTSVVETSHGYLSYAMSPAPTIVSHSGTNSGLSSADDILAGANVGWYTSPGTPPGSGRTDVVIDLGQNRNIWNFVVRFMQGENRGTQRLNVFLARALPSSPHSRDWVPALRSVACAVDVGEAEQTFDNALELRWTGFSMCA